jgi:DNA (cytosine-5)-methyltransferase 1
MLGDKMDKSVVELFAGVGGFRVGLNSVKLDSNDNVSESNEFNFVWANQWEPSTKTQDAFQCYIKRFGLSNNHVNEDISKVAKNTIPNHTLLVGGFPCQDYSVARSLSNEKGIEGKKGVLWWQIADILSVKRPPFVLLENVDRLLKSPSKQRGRDFGVMLRCFTDFGYNVEWRVINAAEYSHPQRRRRIYIFAYHSSTLYSKLNQSTLPLEIIQSNGLFAKQFPIKVINHEIKQAKLTSSEYSDLVSVSNAFQYGFENSGYCIGGIVYTVRTDAIPSKQVTLSDIIQVDNIPDEVFASTSIEKIQKLKDKKRILREKNGISYFYSEGAIAFPDYLDRPGRTMLTSEGTTNRSSHVVTDINSGRYRLITPIEAERLNEFPDNWTNTGMTSKRRYFMMGNALVCGVIQKIGNELSRIIDSE